MRSQKSIVQKIKDVEKLDLLGTQTHDLVIHLNYKSARPFLKEEATEKEWKKSFIRLTNKIVKKKMIDYMDFAWDKANGCRGISAARTMDHYTIWIWLLGDEAIRKIGDLQDYNYYGKDNLIKLCKFLDLDYEKWDDHIRTNSG